MFRFSKVSPRRAREIVRTIAFASNAKGRFFVLLITASMIAAFGLIANSTAVIIGAMLVSPLMTPIFGAALGMLRGNPRLLGRALRSEAIGVVLAIGAAYLIGLPQLIFSGPTEEMLSRTQPNLIDLFVAILAGFAGAYALLDERVSPALPGVAIATAIVPPLSTCGLCLALGAWSAASGAMLLFLANFVSILLVGLGVFWAGGLARSRHRSLRSSAAHFGPTAGAFVAIAIILTNSMIRISRDRRLEIGIYAALDEQLSARRDAQLEDVMHSRTPRGVQVMATVRSHRTISPSWVTSIESAMEASLATPIDLVVRSIRSRDVCSIGSSLQVVRSDLDGIFLVPAPDDNAAREALAAQVIREHFEDEPGFELTRVEYGISADAGSVLVAYVNTIRRLTQEEVVGLEDRLRDRFRDPTLNFFVRVNSANLRGREGPIYVEWTNVRAAGRGRGDALPEIESAILQAVEAQSELVPMRVHFHWSEPTWRALVEVIGPGELGPGDVHRIRAALPAEMTSKVELLILRRQNFIVTEDGYSDYDSLIEPGIRRRTEDLRNFFGNEPGGPTS